MSKPDNLVSQTSYAEVNEKYNNLYMISSLTTSIGVLPSTIGTFIIASQGILPPEGITGDVILASAFACFGFGIIKALEAFDLSKVNNNELYTQATSRKYRDELGNKMLIQPTEFVNKLPIDGKAKQYLQDSLKALAPGPRRSPLVQQEGLYQAKGHNYSYILSHQVSSNRNEPLLRAPVNTEVSYRFAWDPQNHKPLCALVEETGYVDPEKGSQFESYEGRTLNRIQYPSLFFLFSAGDITDPHSLENTPLFQNEPLGELVRPSRGLFDSEKDTFTLQLTNPLPIRAVGRKVGYKGETMDFTGLDNMFDYKVYAHASSQPTLWYK